MLINLILTSLFCAGLYASSEYELDYNGNPVNTEALWWVKWKARKVLGEFWSKPFIGCLTCMGSFWGLVSYVTIYHENLSLIHCVFYIFALSGSNTLYARITNI